MICGATGAIAIVAAQAVHLGNATGIEGMHMKYLVVALLFAGVIQVLIGIFKFGRFIRLIPHPVMMGFVNGLAIVIALGQFLFFKASVGVDEHGNDTYELLSTSSLGIMIGQDSPTLSQAQEISVTS